MPRKSKRKVNAIPVNFQAENVGNKKMEETQKTFQKLPLDNSRCSFLRATGNRKYDKQDAPFLRVGVDHSNRNCPRTGNHMLSTRQQHTLPKVDQSKVFTEKTPKNARSHQRWEQSYGRSSGARVHAAAAKTTISPLRRNRFYELREKTPDREERQKKTPYPQPLLPKKEIHHEPKPIVNGLWWNPKNTFDIETTPRPPANVVGSNIGNIDSTGTASNMGNVCNPRVTSLFGTHVGTDGTRSRISNWRGNIDPNPFWEQKSQQYAEMLPAPPPTRHHEPVVMPIAPLDELQENIALSGCEKIAPLRNLSDPGRDMWVSKPEHANYSHMRCVKILPQHHQCGGRERYTTPNDMDTQDVVGKLEQHRRPPKPGAKSSQCICLRKARRAYCTACKSNIIGRVFRRCRQHPEVGFLTDHFYCPYCLAEPSVMKDV